MELINYNNLNKEQLEEFIEFVDWSLVPYNLITEDIKNKFGFMKGLKARLWFKNTLSQIEIKIDKDRYPDSIFFFIGDKFFMEQNSKFDVLRCSYERIWLVLTKEYKMNDIEIQIFIKNMVEDYFNLKASISNNYNNIQDSVVEEHFKMKISIPYKGNAATDILMEEHFKTKK